MNEGTIAASLHISSRTVEYQVATILKRVAVKNMVEAVAHCYVLGVLTPHEWPRRWSGQLYLPSKRSNPCSA
jgi:predicted DNA-binding transcriptional regulator